MSDPMFIAEKMLLGCILQEPANLLAVKMLRPADFAHEAHARLWRVMRQLGDEGIPITFSTLIPRLIELRQLEQLGGAAGLSEITQSAPPPPLLPQVADLAQRLLERRAERKAAARRAGYLAPRLAAEEAQARLDALVPGVQSLDRLLREAPGAPRWVVAELLPAGLTLLASKPKLGKSWLAFGLALAAASGGPALGAFQTETGAVLYLALEDHPRRLGQRVRQLWGEQPIPPALEVATRWPHMADGGLEALDLWLQSHPTAHLVVVDTLAKIRSTSGAYNEDYDSLEGVQTLAQQYGVAVLVIHHTVKESRQDPLDEINATAGLAGVADNLLVLRRERGVPTAMLVGEGRDLRGCEWTLHFDEETGAWTLGEPPEAQAKTPERTQILDVVKASDGPLSTGEIAQRVGKTVATTSKLLRGLLGEGLLRSPQFGIYIVAGREEGLAGA